MSDLKQEKELLAKVTDHFKDRVFDTQIQRERRVWAKCHAKDVKEIMAYFKNDLGVDFMPMVSGQDCGENYEVIYHLSAGGIVFNMTAVVPVNNPDLDSVTDFYPGSANMERELTDMFGINVTGIPEGERYPLPEDWPQDSHPLRKNWKPEDYKEVK